MKWKDVLKNWKNGVYPKFSNGKKPFIWRTSPYYTNSLYSGEIIYEPKLDVEPNYKPFSSKFKKKYKYVVSFPNLSGDTILVVPIPKRNKNFSSLYIFNKNASNTQKKIFWKKVAEIAIKEQKKHGKVWISTHGLGVAWLHVRISTSPKYYGNSKLK